MTTQWIEKYRREGWAKVERVLSDSTIKKLGHEAERIRKQYSPPDPQNLRLAVGEFSGKHILEQVSRVSDVSPLFKSLISHPRIVGILNEIYGSQATVFKDKLMFKPPGAKGALLHQDYAYWQGFPRSLATVAIPIDATTRQNGCTRFFGPWRDKLLPMDEKLCVQKTCLNEEDSIPCEMEPGDICVFDCMTPHCSSANTSTGSRRCLFFSYERSIDGDHFEEHHEHFLAYTQKYFRSNRPEVHYYFD